MPPLKRLVRFSFLLLFAVILFNIVGYFLINNLSVRNRLSDAGENTASSQQIYMQQIVGKISALSIHHHFSKEQFANQLTYLREANTAFTRGQDELNDIVERLGDGAGDSIRVKAALSDVHYRTISAQANTLLNGSQVNETEMKDPSGLHAASGAYLPLMKNLHDRFRSSELATEARIEALNRALIISMTVCLLYLGILVIAPIFRQSTRTYNELQRSLEEVRRTQELLHDSERKYRHLFQYSPMPMWIFDTGTLRFLEVNEMAIAHYGYSAEEFLSMTLLDIRPPEDREELKRFTGTVPTDGAVNMQGQWRHLKKNGEPMVVEISSHRLDYNGRPAALVLAKDVTRNIELQRQLIEDKVGHQREIARASIMVQEKERNEIGRELHDNVNQILTSVKLHLEFMGNNAADQEKHRQISLTMVSTVIQEIRRLSRSLVPPTLDDVGLVPSIADLTESINTLGHVQLSFQYEHFEEDVLPAGLKLTLLRIVQEQTTNILKYASATEARIELLQVGEKLLLRISDNGVGFDPQVQRKGIGLTNITNRADVYHGQLLLQSEPGKGCVLEVSFDLDKVLEFDPRLAADQAE